jgi:UDP-N-acetyl-D-glucosamine dehydrogenase
MGIQVTAPASLSEQVMARLRRRAARVAVVGLGYVGLPLAGAFADAGHAVVGFDIDPEKVKKLQTGRSYLRHIAPERVVELLRSGRFEATTSPGCFEDADAILLCVPTPLTEAREPDLASLVLAGETVRRHLRRGHLVVLESSTVPGTTEDVLRPILEQSGLRAGTDFFLACSPEREDPGNPQFSTRTVRKVVGGVDPTSRDLAVALYEPVVEGVLPVSSARVAEACKVLENTYRAVNLALVNELKVVLDALGVDVWEVLAAARTQPSGCPASDPGPGGPCSAGDPFSLSWAARRHGIASRLLEQAAEVNTAMPAYVVRRVADALDDHGKPVRGSRVCVLGVAYRKDVDDARASPALPILEMLQERGAHVSYNDPYVPELPAPEDRRGRLTSEPLSAEFLAVQDCVLIVTDHSNYPYDWIVRHAPLVVDTRNATRGLTPAGGRVRKA